MLYDARLNRTICDIHVFLQFDLFPVKMFLLPMCSSLRILKSVDVKNCLNITVTYEHERLSFPKK